MYQILGLFTSTITAFRYFYSYESKQYYTSSQLNIRYTCALSGYKRLKFCSVPSMQQRANAYTQSHKLFDVYLPGDQIRTTVTANPSVVTSWIAETESIHRFIISPPLIIGLDVEWRPSYSSIQNPVATLQLCVADRCLIVQLLYCPTLPQALVDFLQNDMYIFAGVGIGQDAQKLASCYHLSVGSIWELGPAAAEVYGDRNLSSARLKDLALSVLGKRIDKPRRITMSDWDAPELSPEQVLYACVDAFRENIIIS